MNNNDLHDKISDFHKPVLAFFVVIFISFLGFFAIGPFIGIIFSLPFFNFDLIETQTALTDPLNNPSVKGPMFLIQGISSLVGFVIIPLIYLKTIQKKSYKIFFKKRTTISILLFLTGIIILSFMFVNSLFIEWNANFNFPESLSQLEGIARTFEERARELTDFLTHFSSISEFLVGLLVIAIIPAIGEELVFRGLLQNLGYDISKNHHVAIWASAILFSAFHLQFFGFVPRVFLGALFGYLYFWSGNLTIPIFAHFINNGFTLLMVYLYNTDTVDFDIENTESNPLSSVIIFAIITIGLLYLFKNYSVRSKEKYE